MLNRDTSAVFLSASIPPELLQSPGAATFRHVFDVTRSLGFRYLWIDSLCIMQDNDSEKAAEIAHMEEVYSDSSLNISATDAESGSDGLIFDRNPLAVNPCRRTMVSTSAQKSLSNSEPLIACTPWQNEFRDYVTEAPLNKRVWVFQERTLTPRVVYFTKKEIYWECHSLRAPEIHPVGGEGHCGDRR
ncbi:heterokaryon incompatibility protein-domain-containing protein [Podospora didyma]|uniref:Heterokaryon incompatibility protein-domain-containing protein n=1 Tax=Podospora didyma TaxID=330526 RepID=A0AAE0NSH6_9PEZI|nr:heterokaryon incompatibility protein-domain-containing protein [Podospora didyma]